MERREYEAEPVYYCRHCLSLRIKHIADSDIDFCDECGGTDIDSTDIYSWKDMYREKYGKDFSDYDGF